MPDAVKVKHFHLDHLGTPRLITGNGGIELSRHTYYAFGGEAGGSSSGEKQFTGHERDSATLDYMHARYYYPQMGRFLSVDPVIDVKRALRSPQMWNRYSYVTNNPLNRVDPDGRLVQMVGNDEERKKAFELLKSTLREQDRKYVTMNGKGIVSVDAKAKGGVGMMMLRGLARKDVPTVSVQLGSTVTLKTGAGPSPMKTQDLQAWWRTHGPAGHQPVQEHGGSCRSAWQSQCWITCVGSYGSRVDGPRLGPVLYRDVVGAKRGQHGEQHPASVGAAAVSAGAGLSVRRECVAALMATLVLACGGGGSIDLRVAALERAAVVIEIRNGSGNEIVLLNPEAPTRQIDDVKCLAVLSTKVTDDVRPYAFTPRFEAVADGSTRRFRAVLKPVTLHSGCSAWTVQLEYVYILPREAEAFKTRPFEEFRQHVLREQKVIKASAAMRVAE